MASQTVNRVAHGTLVASTTDTILFAVGHSSYKVLNRSTSYDIYLRYDGIAATPGGADCDIVLAGQTAVFSGPAGPNTTFSLISTGTPSYTIAGA